MIHGKKVVVVMPAYNAELTLERTYQELPHDIVDDVILVDDASKDATARVASSLGIKTIVHEQNIGYGGNQKTCYRTALAHGADIVVMVHPDYQYTPKLVTAMASLVGVDQYDFVLASRILCGSARMGGMPAYKYFSNRTLTFIQNLLLSAKFSEYHTGYRAFSRELLEKLPLNENSNDFVFDNQMIAQALMLGFRGGEVSCPCKYFAEASSINFRRSVTYGLGVLLTSVQYFLHQRGLAKFRYLSADGERLQFAPIEDAPPPVSSQSAARAGQA